MEWDRDGFIKPTGPADWYEGRSAEFARRCPASPAAADEDRIAFDQFPLAEHQDPEIGRFIAAYVGHAEEAEYRADGSSGGLTSWTAAELLRQGAVDGVAHVVAVPDPQSAGRFFEYRISRSPDAIRDGAKSRYYPVELSEVLREIRAVPGRYAVVGIPCFIKAVQLLRRADRQIGERVTHTLGIFCGHMKSAHMIESFAWQLGTEMDRVQGLDYRLKDPSRPANWYRAHLSLTDGAEAAQDWWHLVDGDWGAGFFQNPACNFCDDVVAETADISFGDAWVEPYSSDGRGTNVVIVRSEPLHQMIEDARREGRLRLEPVDAAFVTETQAAGLRHRREGLAYRLTWRHRGVTPRKRVGPSAARPSLRRRLVYRSRAGISAWSHRMFRVAKRMRMPRLYLGWARLALTFYQALTYSRGRLGKLFDRLERALGG